jgi:hypothetical protein
MIEFDNPNHAYSLYAATKTIANRESDVIIARSEGDRLMGGIIYQNYTGRSITCHVASFEPNWINIDLLWVAFHYPFVQLKCAVMLGLLPITNTKALEFDKKLGFKEEAIIRDVYPEGDMVVLSLRKEDCRWLKLKPRTITQPEYE